MKRSASSEPMDWERPSERFLAYLERLSAACVERDREELDKLLRFRLSSHLPRPVLDELEYFRRARRGGGGGGGGGGESGRASNLRAPLKLMRHLHKMRQLATAEADETQLPLELRERDVAAPIDARRRQSVKEEKSGKGE